MADWEKLRGVWIGALWRGNCGNRCQLALRWGNSASSIIWSSILILWYITTRPAGIPTIPKRQVLLLSTHMPFVCHYLKNPKSSQLENWFAPPRWQRFYGYWKTWNCNICLGYLRGERVRVCWRATLAPILSRLAESSPWTIVDLCFAVLPKWNIFANWMLPPRRGP